MRTRAGQDGLCGGRCRPLAYGRFRDAGQFFQLLPTPTPGAANTTLGNLPPALSWVSATPPVPGSGEAVEVTCRATDADGIGAVELHWRANGGTFATLAMSALGADRHGATLAPQPNGTLVEYYVTATDALSATATKPAEGALAPYHYQVVDSALDFLEVNEIVASNSSGAQDEAGEFEDWIELHNASSGAFDLSGMFLSDDLANTTKWEIPAGTAIPGGGYLHVWADDEPLDGPLHATFKLSAGGEDVGLFDVLANGNGLIDGYSYGAQTSDVAFGRLPDGTSSGYLLSTPSPGASNLPAPGSSRVYEHADSAANPVVLVPAGSPVVGGSIGADLSSAPPSRSGVFVLGLAPADAAVPGSGYALVAQPVAAWTGFMTSAAGTASLSFAVPADPGLIGYRVYTQAVLTNAGLSNGAVATIGP